MHSTDLGDDPSKKYDEKSHAIEAILLSGDRWKRMRRFAAIVVLMLFGFLLLNALFVGYSLYQIYHTTWDQIDIQQFKIEDLCEDRHSVHLKVNFKDVAGLDTVGGEFEREILISIILAEISHVPIANLTIPSFAFGYDRKYIDFSEIPITVSIEEAYQFKQIVSLLFSGQSDIPCTIKISAALKTSSFIIPIRIDRTFTFTQTILKAKGNRDRNKIDQKKDMVWLEKINFGNATSPQDIRVESFFSILPEFIPTFLSVSIPEINIDVYKLNAIGSQSEHIANLKSPEQGISNAKPSFQAILELALRDKLSIIDCIKRVIRRDEGMIFYIQSTPGQLQSECKLQRIITNIDWQVSFGELMTINTNYGLEASALLNKKSHPSVAKFALKSAKEHIKLETSLDSEYFMGLAGLRSTRIVGQFPSVSLSLIVEHGAGSSATNTTLSTLSIHHQSSSETGRILEFDISMGIRDGEKLVMAAVRAAQIDRPLTAVHPELRQFKRLFLTGSQDETLMSAIMAIFEMQLKFNNGNVCFTNDFIHNDDNLSTVQAGYVISDFLPPHSLSETVHHSVRLKAKQTAAVGSVAMEVALQKAAVMSNPVIELEWDRIELGAAFAAHPLFTLDIDAGKLSCSLAPLRPSLLLHNGHIRTTFSVGPDVDQAIGPFLALLKDGSKFAPISLTGSIGATSISLTSAVPPLSALSNTAHSLEQEEPYKYNSHLKMIGMKGSKLQMLVNLGDKHACPGPAADFGSIVDVEAELPDLTSNACLFKDSHNLGCMATMQSRPMRLTAKIVDSVVCGVQTEVLPEDSESAEANEHRNNGLQSVIHQHANSTLASNWLPLTVNVIDYKKAFEALDAMYEDVGRYSISPGTFSETTDPKCLNRIFDGLSSIVAYQLNSLGDADLSRDLAVKNVHTTQTPIETVVNIWSEDRHSLKGEVVVRIPDEPASDDAKYTDCSASAFEWGAIELQLAASDQDWFRMSMSEGLVYIAAPNGHCPPSTTAFKLTFQLQSGVQDLTSGDLRRVIHHLVDNYLGKGDSSRMEIDKRRLQMTARVGEYRSPREFTTVDSNLKLKTLAQLGHASYVKYKYGKPSGVPADWSAVLKLDALPQVSTNRTTTDIARFPCFFNEPCGDLIYEPSSRSYLAKATIQVNQMVQRIYDTSINTIGSMVNKMALTRYPTRGALRVHLHSPLFLTATLNDNIDIAEVIVPPLRIEKLGEVPYPGCSSGKQLLRRSKRITNDRQFINVYLQVPQYYHDLVGLLSPIDFDPLMRITMKPPPYKDMYYSPFSVTLSNDRVDASNLLSTLACVLLEEIPTAPMPSSLGAGSDMVVTAPVTNENLLEIDIQNMSIPNPLANMAIHFDRPFIAEYDYRGRVFGRARIDLPALDPGNNPVQVRAQLTKNCFGLCREESEQTKEDMGRFLAGAALGAPIEITAVAHLAPGLSVSIPFKHPHRLVPLAVFDAEATLESFAEYGIRTVNALDPLLSQSSRFFAWLSRWTGKAASSASQRTHNHPDGTWKEALVTRLWQWWNDGADADTENAPTDADPSAGWGAWITDWWNSWWPQPSSATHPPTTRGKSNYDLNIPICLRNEIDLEMRLFGLYLNIAFDDTDGFYFSKETDRSPIRNTMFLAQRDCQPNPDTPFHRDSYLQCIREHPAGPASTLHARSTMSGKNVVMTPIPLSSLFVARVFDEAVNHDGPCLRITPDSFISVGLSNGVGRDDQFTINVPLEFWKDLEMNPFGDACGTKTKCLVKDGIKKIAPLHYRDKVRDRDLGHRDGEQLNTNDTFHLNNGQVWFVEQLGLMNSWEVEFTFEFTQSSSYSFASVPGLTFVLQQNGLNATLSDAMYGYSSVEPDAGPHKPQKQPRLKRRKQQTLSRSVAVLFEPHTSDTRPLAQRTVSNIPYLGWKAPNAISVLHNGEPDVLRVPNPKALSNEKEAKELTLKKINGVFPPYDTTLHIRIVHNPFEKQLYIYGRGSDRSPEYHTIFPLDLVKLLPHQSQAWFGFTGKAEGDIADWQVHSIRASHLRPDFSKTKIFWPDGLAPKPHQSGFFYLQLRDECDRPMAKVDSALDARLHLVDSQHPRAIVNVLKEARPLKRTFSSSSLLYDHDGYFVDARPQFDYARRMYIVHYTSLYPGRFRIMLRIADDRLGGEDWKQVLWHTILVRPYY